VKETVIYKKNKKDKTERKKEVHLRIRTEERKKERKYNMYYPYRKEKKSRYL